MRLRYKIILAGVAILGFFGLIGMIILYQFTFGCMNTAHEYIRTDGLTVFQQYGEVLAEIRYEVGYTQQSPSCSFPGIDFPQITLDGLPGTYVNKTCDSGTLGEVYPDSTIKTEETCSLMVPLGSNESDSVIGSHKISLCSQLGFVNSWFRTKSSQGFDMGAYSEDACAQNITLNYEPTS